MMTFDQFWEVARQRIIALVRHVIREEGALNSAMWADGKIDSVTGNRASVFINGSSTATASVPVAPHVGTLAAGDEVIVLMRSARDLFVLSKKAL